jgi:hypothetical protein
VGLVDRSADNAVVLTITSKLLSVVTRLELNALVEGLAHAPL